MMAKARDGFDEDLMVLWAMLVHTVKDLISTKLNVFTHIPEGLRVIEGRFW